LTIISFYSAIFIFAQYNASRTRRIEITKNFLHIRCRLLGEITVPLNQITKLFKSSRIYDTRDTTGLYNFGGHNIILEFQEEVEIIRVYGLTKTSRKIAIFIDNQDDFLTLLEEKNKHHD